MRRLNRTSRLQRLTLIDEPLPLALENRRRLVEPFLQPPDKLLVATICEWIKLRKKLRVIGISNSDNDIKEDC